jgi:Protein of unknown function (DUF4038)/Bacterial Ig domain/Domain of unknown function (DUF5060)/Putative collagen-binding domain of a collagenase/Carbohydrate binding domain
MASYLRHRTVLFVLFTFFGVVCASGPSHAAVPSNNLIPNGDIESGIWEGGEYGQTSPSRTWATDFSFSATHSLKITGSGYYVGHFTTGYVPVQVGKKYTVSMQARSEKITREVSLAVHWYRGSTWIAWRPAIGGTLTGTSDWKSLAGEVTAPTGATAARLQIRVESISGSAWADDVVMVDGASSAASTGTDTTAPTVTLSAPVAGSTVTSTVNVAATVSDNVGVMGVQFKLNGTSLGPEVTALPFAVAWNTTSAPDGSHTLTAVARDGAGNVTTSPPLAVTISNAAPSDPQATSTTQYKRWEAQLTSAKTYANPFRDVTVRVQYTGPSGQVRQGFGFWDGDTTFKIRMSFPQAGRWRYTTSASDSSDSGLHNVTGVIDVTPGSNVETNPLYFHGPLRISADARNLEHADGTPFVWLADTLWGATVWMSEAGLKEAIADRRAKHFSVLQTNFARKAEVDTNGETPWSGDRWNVNFMRKVDRMFDSANDQGMYLFVNGLVDLLWDRGITDYQRLIEMIAIRYAAHHVSFSSSMDDPFDAIHLTINRLVRNVVPHQLLTQHPGSAIDGSGNVTTAERYYDDASEHYVMEATGVEGNLEAASFNAIEDTLRLYRHQPHKPVLNGETWYEGINGGTGQISAHLAYLTMLSGGCGYAHGTDLWNARDADLPAWKAKEGSTYLKFLYDFFVSVDNGRALIPRHNLIQDQTRDHQDRQVLASTADGSEYVAYLPNGGTVRIDLSGLRASALTVSWFNPLTGASTNDVTRAGGGVQRFESPLGEAMVLLRIRKAE